MDTGLETRDKVHYLLKVERLKEYLQKTETPNDHTASKNGEIEINCPSAQGLQRKLHMLKFGTNWRGETMRGDLSSKIIVTIRNLVVVLCTTTLRLQ